MPANTETIKYARVIDHEYTFERVLPPVETARGKRILWCWECKFGEDDELGAKALVNEYEDGKFEPWALPGVDAGFAGAAAIEVVIRLLQRDANYVRKHADDSRKRLLKILSLSIPGAMAVGVLVGFIIGASH